MKQIYTNNASGILASSITASDLEIVLENGQGSAFPEPTSNQFFLITLENEEGLREIARCTSRTGDALTVERGFEGTSAEAFNAGARVECRVTAGSLDRFLQREGDFMDGDLDMGDNEVQNADIRGNSTFQGQEIVATPIRGESGVTNNQFLVPPSGPPTIGGNDIFHQGRLPLPSEIQASGTPGDNNFLRGDGQWASSLIGNFSFTGTLTEGDVPWARLEDVPQASLSQAGIVQLYDGLDSDSDALAATAGAVKIIADQLEDLNLGSEGEFTGTLTGFSGTVEGTFYWRREGNTVTLYTKTQVAGTSNSTSMSLGGIPSEIQPDATRSILCEVRNSGRQCLGRIQIGASATATLQSAADQNGVIEFVPFWNQGSKGLPQGWSVTYAL